MLRALQARCSALPACCRPLQRVTACCASVTACRCVSISVSLSVSPACRASVTACCGRVTGALRRVAGVPALSRPCVCKYTHIGVAGARGGGRGGAGAAGAGHGRAQGDRQEAGRSGAHMYIYSYICTHAPASWTRSGAKRTRSGATRCWCMPKP